MELSDRVVRTLRYYEWFCAANGIVNIVVGFWLLWIAKSSATFQRLWFGAETADQLPDWFVAAFAITLGIVAFVFGFGNLMLPRIPRTKSAWGLHLVNLALALGSCYLTLPALYVLYWWVRPDLKALFCGPAQ